MGRETVGLGLFTFGCFYAWLTNVAETRGWTEGLLSLWVAGGSAVTIFGVWLVDPQAASLTLTCFVCSGLPMVIWSLGSYVRAREQGQSAIREDVG
jgi:hypothetical protein